MENSKNIEGYACFQERLDMAVSPFSVKNGALILESDPEPGYFSRNGFPENLAHASDHHLYVMTKKPVVCFQDWVIQQSFIIKNKYNVDFHISPGQLMFENKYRNCIRIKINELKKVSVFYKILNDYGISLIKHKKVHPFSTVVNFKKHIEMKAINDGIYQDVNDKNRHFVEFPQDVIIDNHEDFETIIENIKNNCKFNMFNAALVRLPRRNRVMNLIAVYSHHCDEQKLPDFKYYLDQHL